MSGMTWFRMYVDFLEDAKMLSLAFEDQRHFIGVLALKSGGVLDQDCTQDLMDRIVAQKLWIDQSSIKEVKRRLIGAGLIDKTWQPLAWNKRQFISDKDPTNAARQRRHRERKHATNSSLDGSSDASCNGSSNALRNSSSDVSVTHNRNAPDTDTDTDTDTETEHREHTTSVDITPGAREERETDEPERNEEPPRHSADLRRALDGGFEMISHTAKLHPSPAIAKADLKRRKDDSGYSRFREAWGGPWQRDRECWAVWDSRHLEVFADELIADVRRRRSQDADWKAGFGPGPFAYLSGARWNDDLVTQRRQPSREFADDIPF